MNRKLYWTILLNPLALILYAAGLRVLTRLFQWGGVARRLPVLIALGFAGVLWFIIWTIVYFRQKRRKKREVQRGATVLLTAELLIFVLLTGYAGRQIYESAQPYYGKLSWILEEMRNTKKIAFEERDFSRYGLSGIVTALEEGAGLPEDSELYTANTFSVTIAADGQIEAIDGYLYTLSGEAPQSYLITYDAAESPDMTVIDELNAEMYTLLGLGEVPDASETIPTDEEVEEFQCSTLDEFIQHWQEKGIEEFIFENKRILIFLKCVACSLI